MSVVMKWHVFVYGSPSIFSKYVLDIFVQICKRGWGGSNDFFKITSLQNSEIWISILSSIRRQWGYNLYNKNVYFTASQAHLFEDPSRSPCFPLIEYQVPVCCMLGRLGNRIVKYFQSVILGFPKFPVSFSKLNKYLYFILNNRLRCVRVCPPLLWKSYY